MLSINRYENIHICNLIFIFLGKTVSYTKDGKCVIDDGRTKTTLVSSRDEIDDFTVTDSDGNTYNLYTLLGQGKTVFLDLFFDG